MLTYRESNTGFELSPPDQSMTFVQCCATSTLSSATVAATSVLSRHIIMPPVQDGTAIPPDEIGQSG